MKLEKIVSSSLSDSYPGNVEEAPRPLQEGQKLQATAINNTTVPATRTTMLDLPLVRI